MPPPIVRSFSFPPSLQQPRAHCFGSAPLCAYPSSGAPPTHVLHDGTMTVPCAMAVSVPYSSNCLGTMPSQDFDRPPLHQCGGCACSYAIPVSAASQPSSGVASHAPDGALPVGSHASDRALPSPTHQHRSLASPASPMLPAPSAHTSARSAAELSAMLVEAQERICELLDTNLQPLSVVRCELTPAQAEELASMLTETRCHVRKAKQLAAAGSFSSASTQCASARPAQSPGDGDTEMLAESSVETSRSVQSVLTAESSRRPSIGDIGRARSGPPSLRSPLGRGSHLEELSQEASTASEAGRRHYTDRLRIFSRGDSDSRLVNRGARVKALRQSMHRMFQSLSLHAPLPSHLFARTNSGPAKPEQTERAKPGVS